MRNISIILRFTLFLLLFVQDFRIGLFYIRYLIKEYNYKKINTAPEKGHLVENALNKSPRLLKKGG